MLPHLFDFASFGFWVLAPTGRYEADAQTLASWGVAFTIPAYYRTATPRDHISRPSLVPVFLRGMPEHKHLAAPGPDGRIGGDR